MKKSFWLRALLFTGVVLFAAAACSAISAQAARGDATACRKGFEADFWMRFRAVRIIDDHGTGRRWLLVRRFDRPETPAWLLPLNDECSEILVADLEKKSPAAAHRKVAPVIRAGDRVLVSESSAIADVRLEATALGPATTGQELTVRLKLGGHLLRAVATAQNSVRVADGNEVGR
jgi:hypothetical protein